MKNYVLYKKNRKKLENSKIKEFWVFNFPRIGESISFSKPIYISTKLHNYRTKPQNPCFSFSNVPTNKHSIELHNGFLVRRSESHCCTIANTHFFSCFLWVSRFFIKIFVLFQRVLSALVRATPRDSSRNLYNRSRRDNRVHGFHGDFGTEKRCAPNRCE